MRLIHPVDTFLAADRALFWCEYCWLVGCRHPFRRPPCASSATRLRGVDQGWPPYLHTRRCRRDSQLAAKGLHGETVPSHKYVACWFDISWRKRGNDEVRNYSLLEQ